MFVVHTVMTFIHGDGTDLDICDWSVADIVFANSTCFDEEVGYDL